MKNKQPSFEDLLSYFPEIELPINITEDLVFAADAHNKVLPPEIIESFILKWGDTEIDEFTEFVPVLKIKDTDEFHAIIYWKGGLMKYEYFLVTLDKAGNLITKKPIASTISDGNSVKKSVALIDEDMIIHIMAGENKSKDIDYNPSHSQAFNMEILPTGDIIFSLGDD